MNKTFFEGDGPGFFGDYRPYLSDLQGVEVDKNYLIKVIQNPQKLSNLYVSIPAELDKNYLIPIIPNDLFTIA